MRIAWFGPAPGAGGGVPYAATLLLEGLAARGVRLDCFVARKDEPLPQRLLAQPGIEFFTEPQHWAWDRWYSGDRARVIGQVSEQATRAMAQRRLVARMLARHGTQPYDLLYQFSQWELVGTKGRRGGLPPRVVHPQVHAEGERNWQRHERALARGSDPRLQTAVVRGVLTGRSFIQRHQALHADAIIAASPQFSSHISADYRVDPQRIRVVPNPVDTKRFQPGHHDRAERGPATLLFVSRFSVRKGVEMIVELSHRLHDLAGRARILVVGYPSPWSDYERLLDDLHPATGFVHGWAEPEDLPRIYRQADVLLQPSHYEPFGLVVAEALASGLPVVASDCVGATSGVAASCCRTFATGSAEAFEQAVRALLHALEADAPRLRGHARHEAERLFAPAVVSGQLQRALASVTADRSAD